MKLFITAVAAILGLAAAAPTSEPGNAPVMGIDFPDPSQVTFGDYTYGGSGCPAGTVTSSFTQKRDAFTLIFDQFVAQRGNGARPDEARRNCQINLKIRYPQGWQFSCAKAIYRGYANIEKGLTGVQKSSYYFTGSSATGYRSQPFVGPFNGDYKIEDSILFESLVWSPCGAEGLLNINSQVRIEDTSTKNPASPNTLGLLTTDSLDGKVQLITGIQWRKCGH